MALSTDYALRTGAFEPAEASVNAQDLQGACEWAGEGCLGRSRFSGLMCEIRTWAGVFAVGVGFSNRPPHLPLSPPVPGHSAGAEGRGSEAIQSGAGEYMPAASMPSSVLVPHWSLKHCRYPGPSPLSFSRKFFVIILVYTPKILTHRDHFNHFVSFICLSIYCIFSLFFFLRFI